MDREAGLDVVTGVAERIAQRIVEVPPDEGFTPSRATIRSHPNALNGNVAGMDDVTRGATACEQ